MARPETNPFTPGVPVASDLFRGRADEVNRLASKVEKACDGRPQFVFITGERGIGKSSLAALVKLLAERKYDMAAAHAFLGGVHTLPEMVSTLLDEFLTTNHPQTWFGKVKDLFGPIESVGLFGLQVRMAADNKEIEHVVRQFPAAMKSLTDRLAGEHKRGVVLVLDDLNGLASEKAFVDWLKSTIDKMSLTDGRLPICMMLVGLEERRERLISNMPSLARAFDLYALTPWSFEESCEFFREAYASVSVTVEPQALEYLARYSGGLPMLAHEIGDATLNLMQADVITTQNALTGLLNAAEVIEKKHIGPQSLSAINSKSYRATLMKLARDGSPFELGFTRSRLCELVEDNQSEKGKVDNFLRRMQQVGLIAGAGSAGEYRFTTHLARIYLWLEAQRATTT